MAEIWPKVGEIALCWRFLRQLTLNTLFQASPAAPPLITAIIRAKSCMQIDRNDMDEGDPHRRSERTDAKDFAAWGEDGASVVALGSPPPKPGKLLCGSFGGTLACRAFSFTLRDPKKWLFWDTSCSCLSDVLAIRTIWVRLKSRIALSEVK